MFYDNENLITIDSVNSFDNEWVQDSSETLDSGIYNVYQGTGDYSMIKLLINEDIIVDDETGI